MDIGRRVRLKQGHPFRPLGEGVVQAGAYNGAVEVVFPLRWPWGGAKIDDKPVTLWFQVTDLELVQVSDTGEAIRAAPTQAA